MINKFQHSLYKEVLSELSKILTLKWVKQI